MRVCPSVCPSVGPSVGPSVSIKEKPPEDASYCPPGLVPSYAFTSAPFPLLIPVPASLPPLPSPPPLPPPLAPIPVTNNRPVNAAVT